MHFRHRVICRLALFRVAPVCLAVLHVPPVAAGDSNVLSMHGVIRPHACIPSFANDGVADFGTIAVSRIRIGQATPLPEKKIALHIICAASHRFALHVRDNQADSASQPRTFGLGRINHEKVGFYRIRFQAGSIMADGRPARLIHASGRGDTWMPPRPDAAIAPAMRYSWAGAGGHLPVAASAVSTTLVVAPSVHLPETLRAQEIPLTGSATFEVQYL